MTFYNCFFFFFQLQMLETCKTFSSTMNHHHHQHHSGQSLIRDTCELPVKIMLQLISWSENSSMKTPPTIQQQQQRNHSFIEKLPNELLVKIFKYCNDSDFANLRLQCTRFDQVNIFIIIH